MRSVRETADFGPLPKVPRRHAVVTKAELELSGFVLDWIKRHNLTVAEETSILAMQLYRTLQRVVNGEHKKDDPD